jgi:hypothetical protein
MNIPIDRLYQYIEHVAETHCDDNVLIYRFWPHGSKNIKDLKHIKSNGPMDVATHFQIYCNDQEPLNYDLYEYCDSELEKQLSTYNLKFSNNLRVETNIFDQCVLLHSEQGGKNLQKYQDNGNFVLAHYWSHAIIARDWFRFAEHADFQKNVTKKFLVYCRAWTGTREYRLYFADLLIEKKLQDHCHMSFNHLDNDSGIHYRNYPLQDCLWLPKNHVEDYFLPNCSSSNSSADFIELDYQSSEIEIVLETLFDDDRNHLTEKTLRPIACGQPFILCSTPGSLQYLKNYGFKTFDSVWSEEYDNIQDPKQRLECITDLMCEINSWSSSLQEEKLHLAKNIAVANQKLFFSQLFFDQVVGELKYNITTALDTLASNNTCKRYLHNIETFKTIPELWEQVIAHFTADGINRLINLAEIINTGQRKK